MSSDSFSSEDLQFVKKFLDRIYFEYPDLKGYVKVVEEDEQRRDELYL